MNLALKIDDKTNNGNRLGSVELNEHQRFQIRPLPDAPITTSQLLGHASMVNDLKTFLESENMITPLTIAIHGEWGSGKTSLMKTLQANIDLSKFDVIFFEAWKFEYSNPSIGLISTLIQRYEKNDNTARSIIKASAMILSNKFLNTDINMLVDTIRGNSSESITFATKIQALLEKNLKEKKLIIIIDDLDRCDVENCLQILAILKLFLDLENVICVAAVDFGRLQDAWRQKYKIAVGSEDKGQEYLAKIFQIRIGIPVPSTELMKGYIETLMIAPPDGVLDMLSHVAPKNPRGVKRMLNLMSYRASLLNSDVCYESACIWTSLEEIIGNEKLIKLVYWMNHNASSFAEVISSKGDDWRAIKTFLDKSGNQDIIDKHATRLFEFFKNAKLIIGQNSELRQSFDKDFARLYDTTNETE